MFMNVKSEYLSRFEAHRERVSDRAMCNVLGLLTVVIDSTMYGKLKSSFKPASVN